MIRDYEEFKVEILKLTDINLSAYKERQMKRRIDSLIQKNGYSNYDEYVKVLKTDKNLYNEFVNYLTINVSEFFRNPGQWEILSKDVLPALIGTNRSIKVWSSASSTGEEPYTIVMALSKFFPLSSIKILATDIDNEVLRKAQIGLYNAKAVEDVPKEFLQKYFTKVGESYKVNDEIKKCVEFKHHNLLKDAYPSGCDLIVCRNVLIYFTEEAKNDIYFKFNASLKKDGILFVGSTEQIIMAQKYNFAPIKTFFYKKTN
jgi:chemotaxis protein methyltransferase CheR